jgi:DNA-binding MarR family transcriptional regulator
MSKDISRYIESDISTEISSLIKKIGKQFDKIDQKLFRVCGISGLTPPQLFILRNVARSENGLTFKDLAELAHCSRSTITGVVDTMEKEKLVYREQNPADRRSILVKLDKEGNKVLNQLYQYIPPIKINVIDFFFKMSPKELQIIINLLKKLSNSIDEHFEDISE